MGTLKENLTEIKRQKDTYLLPENLKQDVTVLGITGTLEAGVMTDDEYTTALTTVDKILGLDLPTDMSEIMNKESVVITNMTLMNNLNSSIVKQLADMTIEEYNSTNKEATRGVELTLYGSIYIRAYARTSYGNTHASISIYHYDGEGNGHALCYNDPVLVAEGIPTDVENGGTKGWYYHTSGGDIMENIYSPATEDDIKLVLSKVLNKTLTVNAYFSNDEEKAMISKMAGSVYKLYIEEV